MTCSVDVAKSAAAADPGPKRPGSTTCAPTSTSRSRPARCARKTWSTSSATAARRPVEADRVRAIPRFAYNDRSALDKANRDITWLRDESLDDASSIPAPGVLAAEIVEELEAALAQFSEPAASLPVENIEQP